MPCHVSSTSSPQLAVQSCVSTCRDIRDSSGTFAIRKRTDRNSNIQTQNVRSGLLSHLHGRMGTGGVSFISLKVDYVSGGLEQQDGSRGRERDWIEHGKEG